jgi:hypothetical protein
VIQTKTHLPAFTPFFVHRLSSNLSPSPNLPSASTAPSLSSPRLNTLHFESNTYPGLFSSNPSPSSASQPPLCGHRAFPAFTAVKHTALRISLPSRIKTGEEKRKNRLTDKQYNRKTDKGFIGPTPSATFNLPLILFVRFSVNLFICFLKRTLIMPICCHFRALYYC